MSGVYMKSVHFFDLLNAFNSDNHYHYLAERQVKNNIIERSSYIYFLFDDEEGEIVYIGKTIDIFSRIGAHNTDKKKKFSSFVYYRCFSGDLDRVETFLIDWFRPKYNKQISFSWYPLGLYPFVDTPKFRARNWEKDILRGYYKDEKKVQDGKAHKDQAKRYYWFVTGYNYLYRDTGLRYDCIDFDNIDNSYTISFKQSKYVEA